MQQELTKAQVLNHLMRFREMMKGEGNLPKMGINQADTLLQNVSEIDNSLDSKQFAKDLFSEKSIEIGKQAGLKKSIEFVSLSPWSPPPLNRQLCGDLIYLSLKTLEKSEWEITCSTLGFFVSNSSSTVFNPSVKKGPFKTIVELISSISPLFAEIWASNEEVLKSRHVLTLMDTFQPAIPWKTKPPTHKIDPARALDDYLLQGLDLSHDWNEDLVLARQLASDDMVAIVNKDTSVVQTLMEFKRAAVSICLDIVKGAIAPINENPAEPAKVDADGQPENDSNDSNESQKVESDSKMYIHNHIFLSEGYDAKESFDEYGGAEANHVAAGKDIAGIAALERCDLQEVHTIATVLVDYKGRRIVAQSIAPGILRHNEDDESCIVYGSSDGGSTITANPEFEEVASKVARGLHLKSHTLQDLNKEEHTIHTSFETKFVKGSDNRKYVLDLYRTTPIDICFIEKPDFEESLDSKYPHKMCLLRHELISRFYDYKFRMALREHQEDLKAKKEEAEKKGEEFDIAKANEEFSFSLVFNPDTFTHLQGATKEDETLVREASGFVAVMISNLVLEAVQGRLPVFPIDSASLTKVLHQRGINMRYLGKVTKLFEKLEYFKSGLVPLLREEMVSRACKRILRGLMKNLPMHKVSNCISHFFNCLYAENTQGLEGEDEYCQLSSESLVEQIKEAVKSRFRYELKETVQEEGRYTLLRSICNKVGIQMDSEASCFTNGYTAFKVEDVLNIYPIVKHAVPASALGLKAVDHGLDLLTKEDEESQKNGLQILKEAVSIYEQIYTPCHPETGRQFAKVAMQAFNFKDIEFAVELQRNALIVAERTLGLDHSDTIQQYINLGYFEFRNGNINAGMKLVAYGLQQWELLAKENHPEVAAIYSNIGAMCQTLDAHDLALDFFAKARAVNKALFGEGELTANCDMLMTDCYIHQGDFRKALSSQQLVFKFWKKALGPDHEKTKESAEILKQLTIKAVEIAKMEKRKKAVASPLDNVLRTIKT